MSRHFLCAPLYTMLLFFRLNRSRQKLDQLEEVQQQMKPESMQIQGGSHGLNGASKATTETGIVPFAGLFEAEQGG